MCWILRNHLKLCRYCWRRYIGILALPSLFTCEDWQPRRMWSPARSLMLLTSKGAKKKGASCHTKWVQAKVILRVQHKTCAVMLLLIWNLFYIQIYIYIYHYVIYVCLHICTIAKKAKEAHRGWCGCRLVLKSLCSHVYSLPFPSDVTVATPSTSSLASSASWRAGSVSGDGGLGLSLAGDDPVLLHKHTHTHTDCECLQCN